VLFCRLSVSGLRTMFVGLCVRAICILRVCRNPGGPRLRTFPLRVVFFGMGSRGAGGGIGGAGRLALAPGRSGFQILYLLRFGHPPLGEIRSTKSEIRNNIEFQMTEIRNVGGEAAGLGCFIFGHLWLFRGSIIWVLRLRCGLAVRFRFVFRGSNKTLLSCVWIPAPRSGSRTSFAGMTTIYNRHFGFCAEGRKKRCPLQKGEPAHSSRNFTIFMSLGLR